MMGDEGAAAFLSNHEDPPRRDLAS
jgi:hypothetical protein